MALTTLIKYATVPITVAAIVSLAGATSAPAPECIKATVKYNSGNGPNYHVRFCGMGPWEDSPLVDNPKGWTLIIDGGPMANGAVILGYKN